LRFKLILLIYVPCCRSHAPLRADGQPRANGCVRIYGSDAYDLNTPAGARHDTGARLCYKDRLAGAQRAGAIPGSSVRHRHPVPRVARAHRRCTRTPSRDLQPLFERGIFIAAGPKVPREGGVILAARIDRDELDAILATDPFVTEGLATYRVTEFRITRAAQGQRAGAAVTDAAAHERTRARRAHAHRASRSDRKEEAGDGGAVTSRRAGPR
jgi:uncharacterized protein YciI